MRKDELRKLRNLNVTPAIVDRVKNNTVMVTRRAYNGKEYETEEKKYKCFLRCQNLKGYLKVAVFIEKDVKAGIKTPRYEVFINKEGQEWITRELDKNGVEVRWRTAMILNLPEVDLGCYYIYSDSRTRAFVNRDGMRSISCLTIPGHEEKLKKYHGIEKIYKWQELIIKLGIEKKEKAEQAPWDVDMALMPAIPESFVKWMKKDVPDTNYIFYEYKKGGAKTGYCRRCERDVVLRKIPHHRDEIKCPRCKWPSILISVGKIKRVQTETSKQGQLIQLIPGGFVVRTFSVIYGVRTDEYRDTKYHISESRRTLIRGEKTASYEYIMYKNKYMRWCKDMDNIFWRYQDAKKVYRANLPRIISAIDNRSALSQLIKKGKKLNIERYLVQEKSHPVIEMLVKADMEDLALEYVDKRFNMWGNSLMDETQTELTKILRLDKERMRRLKKIGASHEALCWLRQEKVNETIWPDELIQYFAAGRINIQQLTFIQDRLSLVKIYHYLQKQEGIACESPGQLLTTWRDYLNMAKKLKMNTELEMIYKPKNLRSAHDEVIELLERGGMIKLAKATAKKFPKVDQVCETLKKYEYSDGKFCIKAPEGILDIVREGTLLRHCIHTCDYYFDRISSRESYLLFLRRVGQEKTPWYTLEMEPGGNIRQKRTTGDDQKPDLKEAIPFLRKWQKYVQKQMDAEEKELANVADQKRRKNYENLRKNGNQVWHGRLAGKLLADVLEQDFMAVI